MAKASPEKVFDIFDAYADEYEAQKKIDSGKPLDLFDAYDLGALNDIEGEEKPISMPQDKSMFGRAKEYGKTALKGTAEGLTRLNHAMTGGQTGYYPGTELEEELQKEGLSREQELELISKFNHKAETPADQLAEQTRVLDELLPTENPSFGQNALRRGLNELPSTVALPGGSIAGNAVRGGIGSVAAEAAKELGAGELVQGLVGLAPFIGPDLFKKLVREGRSGEVVQKALDRGMTEAEIAPLISGKIKQYIFGKAARGESASKKLQQSKASVDTLYNNATKKAANNQLDNGTTTALKNETDKIFRGLPAKERAFIAEDLVDLENTINRGEATGADLFNFWNDINSVYGDSRKVQILKDPVEKALRAVNPELADELQDLNDLYQRYYKARAILKPTLSTDIAEQVAKYGKVGSSIYGIITGDPRPFLAFGSYSGVKILSQQMLTNPRFQQLGTKMAMAARDNKYQIFKKSLELLKKEVGKSDKQAAEEMNEMTDEELKGVFDLLNQTSSKPKK